MIVTPEYIRTNYLGSSEANDSMLEEFILMAEGAVEAAIHQPVEARSIVWYFDGRPHYERVIPYTLKPVLTSVEERLSVGGSWAAVSGATIENGVLLHPLGFVAGRPYRATLTVGLAAAVGPAISADLSTSSRYGDLLAVLCEMVAIRYMESHESNSVVRRLGMDALSDSDGVGGSKTFTLRDMEPSWRQKLARYRTVRTY